ncbi:hypothetical protein CARUB_v10024768mg [Capsella rubella]|uniref:BHLH domain-containing protein n=1 Tax=Capsella rubella TaxID=81985 RepID=R0HWW4_9BRAS|nr:transcription factor bHLH19 [Capsella rubella]EOA28553.1 hypothetical protein CARUB_v10024768mg [Capsella rubella]
MEGDFITLPDFSLEDIDFDFNIYEADDMIMDSQRAQERSSSHFDHHQMHLEFLREKLPKSADVKPMMKIINNNNVPRLISFDFSSNVSSSPAHVDEIFRDKLVERGTKRKTCSHGTRSPVLAKEHVLAERKRREKLSEKFIALSALLPGLKKADKVTVLDDAISRMKQLQEQIRKLKEEKEAKREMESMILVKRSKVLFDEETDLSSSCPSDNYHNQLFNQALPEIEAKISQNDVLIRIHCEKSKGCMINILNTIENLQLRIENSIVLPFGDSTLDITVLAQMDKDGSVSVVKDLVRNLRVALVN